MKSLKDKVLLPSNDVATKNPYIGFIEKYGIAIAPLIAYLLDFKYESSFCDVYGLPSYFIEISLSSILIFSSIILGFGAIVLVILEPFLIQEAIDNNESLIRRISRLYAPLIAALLFYCELYDFNKFYVIMASIFAGLVVLGDVVFARYISNDKRPFAYRLEGPFFIWSKGLTFLEPIKKMLGDLFPLFIAFYILYLLSGALGEACARQQEYFLVPASHANAVVIRKYAGKLICCEINPETKSASKIFFELDSSLGEKLELKQIGQLHAVPLPLSTNRLR